LCTQSFNYTDVRTALTADRKSESDFTAVANLTPNSGLSFWTNDRDGVKFLDNDGSTNNTVLEVNTANAKALGLLAGAIGKTIWAWALWIPRSRQASEATSPRLTSWPWT
jgi:hypothetical protein